ncbi:hypothetical protein NPIL_177251 [Nephila pilipes]|uniref:C2H2-type domain-containing protein n=1 Tax=Nephila pilipes TaxID=299642 RepID=A0A8X6MSI4_NEPPI|nr:hypothetical protein NPIL_177251 [Nephila pilipes]
MADSSLTDCEPMSGADAKNHEKVKDIYPNIYDEKDYANPTDHENMAIFNLTDFEETTDCEMSDSDEMTGVGPCDREKSVSAEGEKQESHTFVVSIGTEDVYKPVEFRKRINQPENTEEQEVAVNSKECFTCELCGRAFNSKYNLALPHKCIPGDS